MTDQQTPLNNQMPPEAPRSIFGVIVHSFFVVPFLIAVVAVLLFTGVQMLTREEHTPQDYLENIRVGGLTKRWQAAFELSKILALPGKTNLDNQFLNQLATAFNNSVHDDPRVRQYLALALGRTGHAPFVPVLTANLKDESPENLPAILYALGMLRQPQVMEQIESFIDHPEARVRLAAAIALGSLENSKSIPALRKMLNDSELNVRWDTAIALAKLGDLSGKEILLQLLDRHYLSSIAEVDAREQNHILLTTLKAAEKLQDSQIQAVITTLSQSDPNMNVRKLALELNSKT